MGSSTYSGVNDSNLYTLSGNAISSQLVHLGHDMRRKGILSGFINGALLLGDGMFDSGRASPLNGRLGDTVDLDWPDVLDGGQRSDTSGQVIGLFKVVELDGNTLEELVIELQAGRSLTVNFFFKARRALLHVSIYLHNGWAFTYLSLLELNNVGTGETSSSLLLRVGAVELCSTQHARKEASSQA